MAFQDSALGVLVRNEPAQARVEIQRAIDGAGGIIVRAAKDLGVGYRSLVRYMLALRMRPARSGPGHPPAAKKRRARVKRAA